MSAHTAMYTLNRTNPTPGGVCVHAHHMGELDYEPPARLPYQAVRTTGSNS